MSSIACYTPEQMEEIVEFITQNYEGEGYIAHETESEYVHTDVYIAEDEENDMRDFITFGMGAALMDAPIETFERMELIMHTSLNTSLECCKWREAASFLVGLSKYPFRNDTWFGWGHTVDVPKYFEDIFGYQFVLLAPTYLAFSPCDTTNNVENVIFSEIVPIYEDEREWIVANDSFVYLDLLYNKFGDDMYKVDVKREHYIPSEEDVLSLEEKEQK